MTFGTIFFIIVAAIVLFQLRNVLGRRTGNERQPFDPYTRPEKKVDGPTQQGNVITLPSRREGTVIEAVAAEPYAEIDSIVPVGDPVNAELRRVQDADASFAPKQFLEGVKVAYEMIVTAFATGDRKTLRGLLSQEAYQGFESAITDRESRNETMTSVFIGIDNARIVSAAVRDREVLVTVNLVSQLISSVKSATGELVDGDPETVVEVRDVWTFARDVRSRDPNWKLVETQSA
ncbi:calcium-binding protein [Aureimonas sp. SA4125]|uniref:Tim44/TimA family putative adaptor protein n=1 Tax=Aureimonas sp. SA4125 TaxID=2826993 RepID=UPI001CC431AE|nr:Tim44/TimA family putative adaptor protein [Aureimonas sp. SA4125]BDA86853.1 calcium-binding protein [Aureimonas sp. SA4125]